MNARLARSITFDEASRINLDRLTFRAYESPQLRKENEVDVDWEELFFDLIYIGAATKLSSVLTNFFRGDDVLDSNLIYFVQFTTLYDCWISRTLYISRFKTYSPFHRASNAVYAFFVATLSLFISSDPGIGANNHFETKIGLNFALAFSVVAMLLSLYRLGLSFELIFIASKNGIDEELTEEEQARQSTLAKNLGIMLLCRNLTSLVFYIIAVLGALFGKLRIFISGLALAFFCKLLFNLFYPPLFLKVTGKVLEMLPLNMKLLLKRFGDFTMLLLAEIVIYLILDDIDPNDIRGHLLTFFMALFVILHFFVLLSYTVSNEIEYHSSSRANTGGIFVLKTVTFLEILPVGALLRMILEAQGNLANERELRERFSRISTVLVFAIFITRAVNRGYFDALDRHATAKERKIMWEEADYSKQLYSVFLCILSLLLTPLRSFKANGPGFLLLANVILSIILFFVWIEVKLFPPDFIKPEKNRKDSESLKDTLGEDCS